METCKGLQCMTNREKLTVYKKNKKALKCCAIHVDWSRIFLYCLPNIRQDWRTENILKVEHVLAA